MNLLQLLLSVRHLDLGRLCGHRLRSADVLLELSIMSKCHYETDRALKIEEEKLRGISRFQ